MNNFRMEFIPTGFEFSALMKYVVWATSNGGTGYIVGAFPHLDDAMECAHHNTGRHGIAFVQVFSCSQVHYAESKRIACPAGSSPREGCRMFTQRRRHHRGTNLVD